MGLMDFLKKGVVTGAKILGTGIEAAEVVSQVGLTSALIGKNRNTQTTAVPVQPSSTAPKDKNDIEKVVEKIKTHFGGLGKEDEVLRKKVLGKLVPSRRDCYMEFERWLKTNHFSTWAALMHYLTTEAGIDEKLTQKTYEEIAERVKGYTAEENEAALTFVRSFTGDVLIDSAKHYASKILDLNRKFNEKHTVAAKSFYEEQKAKYEARHRR